jgi:hypothetical protein
MSKRIVQAQIDPLMPNGEAFGRWGDCLFETGSDGIDAAMAYSFYIDDINGSGERPPRALSIAG